MPGPNARSVFDKGESWSVYERSDRTRRRALIFESEATVRVVRDFPENWRELPISVLMEVSWRK